jgi:GTP-binding protein Era
MNDQRRCGFVTILGEPNAGKSTLLNNLMGTKISIVSPKVQTTRARLLGIITEGDTQIVIQDTPGIFSPKTRLEKAMVKAAWDGLQGNDCLLVLVDCMHQSLEKAFKIFYETQERGSSLKDTSLIVILNKIDKIHKEKLLTFLDALKDYPTIDKIFMVSALKGDGVEDLKKYLMEKMPLSPWHYPEDQLTDKPERFLTAEVTREHLFHVLHKELPYHLTVETEKWEEFKDGSVKISQLIRVSRENHRKIVIGEGGKTLKKVGQNSRKELEEILGRSVHLFLFVKIDEQWSERRSYFTEQGLDFDS